MEEPLQSSSSATQDKRRPDTSKRPASEACEHGGSTNKDATTPPPHKRGKTQADAGRTIAEDGAEDQHEAGDERPGTGLLVESNEDDNGSSEESSSSEKEAPRVRSPVLKKLAGKKKRQLRNAQQYRKNKRESMTIDPGYNENDEKYVVACMQKAVNEVGHSESGIKKWVYF